MTMTYEEIEQPTVPDQPPGDMEDERDAPAPPPPMPEDQSLTLLPTATPLAVVFGSALLALATGALIAALLVRLMRRELPQYWLASMKESVSDWQQSSSPEQPEPSSPETMISELTPSLPFETTPSFAEQSSEEEAREESSDSSSLT